MKYATMANWAISSVHNDGWKNVFEIDDHSRIPISTKIRYIAMRPSPRFTRSTQRM
jgi:hypothetical protein